MGVEIPPLYKPLTRFLHNIKKEKKMALNWNIEKIQNYKKLCWNGDNLNPITDTLIWGCMNVGMSEITNKNWKDFYLRINFLENMKGTFLTNENGKYYITKKDVYNHIGLSTNVSYEPRSKWLNRYFKREENDLTI